MRGGRRMLNALGIVLATTLLGVALTVGWSLATGFERAADRADLPDVIVRFGDEDRAEVDERIAALPNLAARTYRTEVTRVELRSDDDFTPQGVAQVVDRSGRRGYAILDGRDLDPDAPEEVVIERGLADDWDLAPGDRLDVGGLAAQRVVGIAVAPDNVAFPLARTARIYLGPGVLPDRQAVNMALLWTRSRAQTDVLLAQARAASYGVSELRFVTRAGVQVLVGEAAGIVIALLVAFALVGAGVAGVLLGASAASEVQRRLSAIGVQRAIGLSPGRLVARQALEAGAVALPAAAAGLLLGALLAAGPSDRLLRTLNQLGPTAGEVALLLGGALIVVTALVATASAWPAWRAARRRPAELLRGGDVAPPAQAGASGGFAALGARLALARRARLAATITVLATAAGVVLLLLGLANLLVALRDDPATLGKRYQLTAALPADRAAEVAQVPGVAAAAPRYSARAAASYALGTPVKLIAYPGDHTRFEAPPLASGRRVRSPDEIEVGEGLAGPLGLRPGTRLALQLSDGQEAAFRVVGVVRALEADGRIAYAQPDRLLAAEPGLQPQIAVALEPGADRAAVGRALEDLGAPPQAVGGATTRDGRFLGVLATLLRLVAGIVGLVCLYALAQSLALLTRERRQALALLRATGADAATLARVLAGAAAAAVVPAAVLGVALERLVLAPLVERFAAGYADLPLGAGPASVAVVLAGLLALGGLAAGAAGRRAARAPIASALRDAA